ncbi:MAG: hypothetical protein KBA28_04470 [Syntrophaceae bacterium]|nr:hypothetical protein [Syntrophaceae bacterium]
MTESSNPLIYLIFLVITVGVIVVMGVLIYFFRKNRRIRRSFEDMAKRVHGKVVRKNFAVGDVLEGQHASHSFSCRYIPGSKNQPSSLRIQLDIPCKAALKIRKRAWYDRFAAQFGLIAEIRTGDTVFDSTYYLDTDHMDLYSAHFAGNDKRLEVASIFSLGFPVQEIVFGKKDIRILLSPFQYDRLDDVPLEKYLDTLLNLSINLSSSDYSEASFAQRFGQSYSPPLSREVLVTLFIVLGVFIFGGFLSLMVGLEKYQLLNHHLIANTLALSALAFLVFQAGIYQWIRGRASSHRLFFYLLTMSFVAFPLGMTGGAVATNGFLDEGSETVHRVSVKDHYIQKNKNDRTYYLSFVSWRNEEPMIRISVSSCFFKQIEVGDLIDVKTKPGYWNAEWISGIEKAPSGDRMNRMEGIPLSLLKIRFYESGPSALPGQNQIYSNEFAGETSRYIYCHVNMENHLWRQDDRRYTFVWQYIKPGGDHGEKLVLPFTIRKEWKSAWVVNGWGWEKPGKWPPGSYRVEVSVDGHSFGEGSFTIR